MSAQQPALQEWLATAVAAVEETAAAMGFGACSPGERTGEILDKLCGSYIALVGDRAKVQLGFLSSFEGHKGLARTMLAMEPEESIETADVADAVCEIVNILAGNVKRGMSSFDADLKLGLPVFVNGQVEETSHMAHAATHLRVGEIAISLVVFQGSSD